MPPTSSMTTAQTLMFSRRTVPFFMIEARSCSIMIHLMRVLRPTGATPRPRGQVEDNIHVNEGDETDVLNINVEFFFLVMTKREDQ